MNFLGKQNQMALDPVSDFSTVPFQVLMIEDNPLSSRILNQFLKEHFPSCTITMAGSLTEARRVLQESKLDIVLADYYLDDGEISELSGFFDQLAVIVISSSVHPDDIINVIKNGAFDYLVKDKDYNYLEALPLTIHNALRYQNNKQLLEASLLQYNELVNTTSDLIQSIDNEGKIIYANKAWEKRLGLKYNGTKPIYIKDIVHPNSIQFCNELFGNLKKGVRVGEIELSFIGADKDEVILKGNINPRYENGKLISTRGIFHEITDLRQKEKDLAESKQFIEGVLENIPEVIYSLDEDLKLLFLSRKGLDLYNWTEDNFRSVNYFLLPYILPEDTPLYMDMLNRGRKGEAYSEEFRIIDRHGSVHWIQDSGGPVFDEDGNFLRLDGSLYDITGHKENEKDLEKLSLVANKTDSYVIILSGNKTIEWVNASFNRLSGYKTIDVIGKSPSEIFENDVEAGIEELSLGQSPAERQHEEWILTKDGQRKCLSFQSTPIFDEGGHFEKAIIIGMDITSKIETQKKINEQNEQLQQIKKELERSNKQLQEFNTQLEKKVEERTSELTVLNERLTYAVEELDNFYYRTSHNLRGPIARILGLVNLGKIESNDDMANQYFDLMRESANQMDNMLETIQHINQINNTNPKDAANINLKNFFETITKKFQSPSTPCTVEIHCTDQPVNVNLYLLQQAVSPVVKNAFDHYENDFNREPLLLKASAWVENNILSISISNSGSSLDPTLSEQIFNMFFVNSAVHQGDGLGLYIAKRAVEKLNGQVFLDLSATESHPPEPRFNYQIPLDLPH